MIAWTRKQCLSPTLALTFAVALSLGIAAAPAQAIPCLSGFVRGPDGSAVAGADLDFTISATRQRILTPGDNTDAGGFYTVCVLPNIYDVAYAPPPGSRLLGQRLIGVDLTDEAGRELDVTLTAGQTLSGVVRGPLGAAIAEVDIDVDRVSGGRIYTPGDNTLGDGSYFVAVPAGLHRVSFEPPRGSRLRGAQIDSVDVTEDAVLDVTLSEGLLLTGTVTGPDSDGADGVDIDLRAAGTGEKIYLANNTTDGEGAYTVAAPAGLFELRYAPARESHLIAKAIPDFLHVGDTVRAEMLTRGHRVVVEVLGTGDLPLAGSDLDVKSVDDGRKLYLPHDRANAAGQTVAVVPAGTWNLIVDPPAGADYAGTLLSGVTVSSDTTFTVRLAGAPRVTVAGRVVDDTGSPVADAAFSARATLDGTEIRLADDRTAADGSFALDLPPVPVNLDVIPPAGTRLVALRIEGASAAADTTWPEIVLTRGQLVTVQVADAGGEPVPGTDLDFSATATAAEIFTPRDNTDATGAVTVAVPAGSYRITATPPAASGFGPAELAPVAVAADTTIALVVSVATDGGGAVLELARPNPFRVSADIPFRLVKSAKVRLAVYDLRGRLLRVLAAGDRAAGRHVETWDGRDGAGRRVPSGLFVVRLESPLGTDTARITNVH